MLFANIGLPMIFVSVPIMAMALIPIAFVEALVFRWLFSLPLAKAWKGAFNANLWSTFLGVPIAWLILVLLEIIGGNGKFLPLDTPLERMTAVILQAPWLMPYPEALRWMVPAASLLLLVPFYLVSVFVEHRCLDNRWQGIASRSRLFGGVLLANFVSYLLLAVYYGGWLMIAQFGE